MASFKLHHFFRLLSFLRILSNVPHCIQLLFLSGILQSTIVPQSSLAFHDTDSSKEYWPIILLSVHHLGHIWYLLILRLRSCFLGKRSIEMVPCLSQCNISQGCWFEYHITGDTDLYHFVNVVSAGHCKVTMTSPTVNKYYGGRYFETV